MKTRWRVLRTRHHDGKVTNSIWMDHFAKQVDAQKEADMRNAMKIRTPKRPKLVVQENPRCAVPVLEWNEPDVYTIEPWDAPE